LLLFLIRVSSVFDPWLFLIWLRPKAALGVLWLEPFVFLPLTDANVPEMTIRKIGKTLRVFCDASSGSPICERD
jgi:hypothetical protein